MLAFGIEALEYCIFGGAFGKWCFSVKVLDSSGRKIGAAEYVRRLGMVFVAGVWCWLPPFCVIPQLIQRHRLKKGKATSYDEKAGWMVVQYKQGFVKGLVVVLFVLGLIGLSLLGENGQEDSSNPQQMEALLSQAQKCEGENDYKGAFNAYCKAVELGSPQGEFGLDCCLNYGSRCFPNPELGYKILSNPEVQKISKARGLLGLMLFKGEGVVRNAGQAFELWDDEAVLNAFPPARVCLASMLLSGEDCEEDDARGFALVSDPKVHAAIPEGEYLLGGCYFLGEGTGQDFEKAAQHIKSAADADYGPGFSRLAKRSTA